MMSEDERLREALEAELEDSYQEYLTLALKGETQDQMQTSPKYERNMKELCRQMEQEEKRASEAEAGSKVVPLQSTRKVPKGVYTFVKVAGALAAVAAVFLVILISNFKDHGLHSRNDDDEVHVAYDNTSSPAREVAAADKNEQVQQIDGVESKAFAQVGEPSVANNEYPAAAATEAEENEPQIYVFEVAKAINSKGDVRQYTVGKNAPDTVNADPSEDKLEIPTIDIKVEEEGLVVSKNSARIVCEIPKLSDASYTDILGVEINGRPMTFTLVSDFETEQTNTLTFDCDGLFATVDGILQVNVVQLNISYKDETIVFVCQAVK